MLDPLENACVMCVWHLGDGKVMLRGHMWTAPHYSRLELRISLNSRYISLPSKVALSSSPLSHRALHEGIHLIGKMQIVACSTPIPWCQRVKCVSGALLKNVTRHLMLIYKLCTTHIKCTTNIFSLAYISLSRELLEEVFHGTFVYCCVWLSPCKRNPAA